MKIVVVGLGETGRALIKLLDGSGHDITVIDRDKNLVDQITDKYTVNGVCGSGASADTLLKAGADTADVIVALTHTDEINLLSCMQAKAVGTKKSAARILMPDLMLEEGSIKKTYNIDYIVSPKKELAEEIYRNIGFPGCVKLENYPDADIFVIDTNAIEGSPLIGRSIGDILNEHNGNIIIGPITRSKKKVLPKESVVIQENDGLYIAVRKDYLSNALKSFGISRKKASNIVIVGGGISAGYLAGMLTSDKKKLTIIDDDLERCSELMERFPQAKVAYAQGDITEVLEEEQVEKADAIVSLTDIDETNLVISMFAWSKGISSIITRVDKQVHVKLLHKVNIDITVSPTELSVFMLMRYINVCDRKHDDENTQVMEFIDDLRRF
ncbi:MAG: NAD-binding protein [Lachnospiraceae bacterium]|nr:NAD-binding protein [Lachnospiraceae bacterium]